MKFIIVVTLFSSLAFAQKDKAVQTIEAGLIQDEILNVSLKKCESLKKAEGEACAKKAIEKHKKAMASLGVNYEEDFEEEHGQSGKKKFILASGEKFEFFGDAGGCEKEKNLKAVEACINKNKTAKRISADLPHCQMSHDSKMITCGDKTYELTGKTNEIDRNAGKALVDLVKKEKHRVKSTQQ